MASICGPMMSCFVPSLRSIWLRWRAKQFCICSQLAKTPVSLCQRSLTTTLQPLCGQLATSCRLVLDHFRPFWLQGWMVGCCTSNLLATYAVTNWSPSSCQSDANQSLTTMWPWVLCLEAYQVVSWLVSGRFKTIFVGWSVTSQWLVSDRSPPTCPPIVLLATGRSTLSAFVWMLQGGCKEVARFSS